MHMITNRNGGFSVAHFTPPVVIFKKVDGKYYAANRLADKLRKYCEAKKLTEEHMDQLRDIGFQVDVE